MPELRKQTEESKTSIGKAEVSSKEEIAELDQMIDSLKSTDHPYRGKDKFDPYKKHKKKKVVRNSSEIGIEAYEIQHFIRCIDLFGTITNTIKSASPNEMELFHAAYMDIGKYNFSVKFVDGLSLKFKIFYLKKETIESIKNVIANGQIKSVKFNDASIKIGDDTQKIILAILNAYKELDLEEIKKFREENAKDDDDEKDTDVTRPFS